MFQAYGQNQEHIPLTKHLKDSLRKEVETMLVNDQKYRWMLMFGELDEKKLAEMRKLPEGDQWKRMKQVQDNKVGISEHQKDSLWQLQGAIDSVNFIKMSGIVRRYGFPKKYVEVYKASAIFLHSPVQFLTDDFFKVLMQEVKNNNMPGLEYATIYDKAQLNNKLPELYYVCEHYDPTTKTSHIRQPKDLEATNRAREEIGLKKIKF
ncbi:MAG: hypothetical protein ACHQD8_00055 [Chitinophagales bacterium]